MKKFIAAFLGGIIGAVLMIAALIIVYQRVPEVRATYATVIQALSPVNKGYPVALPYGLALNTTATTYSQLASAFNTQTTILSLFATPTAPTSGLIATNNNGNIDLTVGGNIVANGTHINGATINSTQFNGATISNGGGAFSNLIVPFSNNLSSSIQIGNFIPGWISGLNISMTNTGAAGIGVFLNGVQKFVIDSSGNLNESGTINGATVQENSHRVWSANGCTWTAYSACTALTSNFYTPVSSPSCSTGYSPINGKFIMFSDQYCTSATDPFIYITRFDLTASLVTYDFKNTTNYTYWAHVAALCCPN